MKEANIGMPEIEKIQARLGKPFSVPLGRSSVEFETKKGHFGEVNFDPDRDWFWYREYGKLIYPAGPVEIVERITKREEKRQLSYPVSPALRLVGMEVHHPYRQSTGATHDHNERMAEERWDRIQQEKLRELLDQMFQCKMLFDRKIYKGLIRLERDHFRRVTHVEYDEWRDPSSGKAVLPLFPNDPNVLSRIQFVLNIKS